MFVTDFVAPEKRRPFAEGGVEKRITEPAVMLAVALHFLAEGATTVWVHPDGEHAKVFDLVGFLERREFERVEPMGSTAYGGVYRKADSTVIIHPASGKGDVVAEIGGRRVVAECKGGAINTSHSGQKSKLRRGLSELIGQLMLLPDSQDRQMAVLPETAESFRLATRLAARCALAGIEIALVQADGGLRFVRTEMVDAAASPIQPSAPDSGDDLKSLLAKMDLDGVDLSR